MFLRRRIRSSIVDVVFCWVCLGEFLAIVSDPFALFPEVESEMNHPMKRPRTAMKPKYTYSSMMIEQFNMNHFGFILCVAYSNIWCFRG